MCCTKFSKVFYHINVPFTLSGSVNLFLFANTRIGSSVQLVQSAEKAIWYHMFTHDAMYLRKLLFTINEHHDCSWMPLTACAFFFLFFVLPFFSFSICPCIPIFQVPISSFSFPSFVPLHSSSLLWLLSSFAFLLLLFVVF